MIIRLLSFGRGNCFARCMRRGEMIVGEASPRTGETVMSFIRNRCRAASTLVLALMPSLLQAAEPLRWKFEPGQSNRYRITQETKLDRSGAGGEATAATTLIIDSSWRVNEVKDDGSALLDQRIDRMRMKTATGEGQTAEIDSKSLENPQGPAAMLVPLLKAVTSHSFTVTMTPRGEITNVDVPQELVEALKNQPGAAVMGDLASEEGFKKLVGQAAFVLPEGELKEGTEFSTKTETSAAAVGKQSAEITYTYEGSREADGETMEVFTPKINVEFEGGPVPIEVVNQTSKGELLFNRTEGRMASSRLEQEMTLNIGAEGQSFDQQIIQTVDMKWLPPEEGEDGGE